MTPRRKRIRANRKDEALDIVNAIEQSLEKLKKQKTKIPLNIGNYINRMWINQPSTLQPLHHLNGTCVLAGPNYDGSRRIWFLSGNITDMECFDLCLSEGWPDHLMVNIPSNSNQV